MVDERSVYLKSMIRNGTSLNSFSISHTFKTLVTSTDSESVIIRPEFQP